MESIPAHKLCWQETNSIMFYSNVVLASMLVGASAFAPLTPSRRFGAGVLQMEADPWNTEADGKNYVDMATLDAAYAKAMNKPPPAPAGGSDSGAQDFLEADPYYSTANIPLQTYKAKEPFIGKIVSTKRIVGAQATGETCDIVINHEGKMPYWEGQSYGVIPPGTNPKNGKPFTNRLYSIASSRYGDDMTGTTTTLCVRRATYWCPEMQAEDPAKKGVCSNFLCDTKPGDEVKLTGPSGKVMLMPEDKPETDLIMVATGTGIAPYRSFWKRLFIEDAPAAMLTKVLHGYFLVSPTPML